MIEPPPVMPGYQGSASSGGDRDLRGWFLLAIVFVLAILGSGSDTRLSKTDELASAQGIFRELVTTRWMARQSVVYKQSVSQYEEALRSLLDEVAPRVKSDPIAAEIYVAGETELGKSVSLLTVAAMASSKDPVDQNAAKIYGSPSLTRSQAAGLSTSLSKRGFLGALMRAHAFRKAGDSGPESALGQAGAAPLGVVLGLYAVLVGGAFVAWMVVGFALLSKTLMPFGLPQMPPTLRDADRLAWRAAGLLGMFLAVSLVAGLVSGALKFDTTFAEIVAACLMLVGVPLLFRKPVMEQVISLRSIGLSRHYLHRYALIGLVGFFLELPAAIMLGVIGEKLFSHGRAIEHPAATQLMNSHDWRTVVAIFFFGAIVAPFWEEIMFRGLLFPALSRLTGSITLGGLLSSLAFALVHPQGIAAVLALTAVGGMSCVLAYYSKSLVPSIVMHVVHNATLMTLALLQS